MSGSTLPTTSSFSRPPDRRTTSRQAMAGEGGHGVRWLTVHFETAAQPARPGPTGLLLAPVWIRSFFAVEF
jgi:hypothetical protein